MSNNTTTYEIEVSTRKNHTHQQIMTGIKTLFESQNVVNLHTIEAVTNE